MFVRRCDRDRILFALHRAPVAPLSGCFELWKQSPSAKRYRPTCNGHSAERPISVRSYRHVQCTALSSNADQQRYNLVQWGIDFRAECESKYLRGEHCSLCERRSEWLGNLRPCVAWLRIYPFRSPVDFVDESGWRLAIQGVRVCNTDLPLSAIKIVRLFVRPVSQ